MKNNVIKWLFRTTGRKKLYILALMAAQALNGISGVIYALFLRNIVDSAAAHNTAGFWKNVAEMILLVAFQLGIRAVIRWLNELSKSVFENTFKERLMKNILHKDFAHIEAVHSGEWLNRLTNDTVIVADSCTEIFPGIVGMAVKLLSALVMIATLDYRFALVLIPCGFVLLILTYAFKKVLKKLHKNMQESDGRLRIFLQERISSLVMIRSFAAEDQTEAETLEKLNAHKSARMKKNHFSNFCNIAMNGMYLFGACYCAYGILTDTISYGTLTAITQLISQVQSPFANITGYLPRFYAMTASAERLMEIESFEEDHTGNIVDLSGIKSFYANEFDGIVFDKVGFRYFSASDKPENIDKTDMPDVLENVSFSIKKGEYIAFTGHSGCGKSTVLKLLMCVYRPDYGEIFLNDKSGNKKLLTAKYQRLFAYVPQGNRLMSGTIREIVSFADRSQSDNDEKIMVALKTACAYEFIGELENGIDTVLGERGAGLSEGQMQRIAIARAVFSESPILIFDEATSALDEITEKQVLDNLKHMTDKTVIIVTHRPAALEICGRILEFTESGITENG